MSATTSEGTGSGSAAKIKPLILNGEVKKTNLEPAILEEYDYDINTSGDISSEGHIRAANLGQLLNTRFYTFNSGDITNDSQEYVIFANVSYTPVLNNSSLLIEYHTPYTVSGNSRGIPDVFASQITVEDIQITFRTHFFSLGSGGGTRSGVLFPISMIYNNTVTTALSIKVSAAQVTGTNDILTVNTNSSYLRISEYAAD
jgi:hypothetical protein